MPIASPEAVLDPAEAERIKAALRARGGGQTSYGPNIIASSSAGGGGVPGADTFMGGSFPNSVDMPGMPIDPTAAGAAVPPPGGLTFDKTDPAFAGLLGRVGSGGRVLGGSGGGGGGGMAGAAPRDYNPASGGVPGVTNPIDAILGNMGGITGIQTGLTDNALRLLREQYGPEYFATLATLQGNVKRRAAGDISDLLPEMWQRNAENAVAGGYSGSAMENSKRLRDMGLTRYQVENDALTGQGKIFGMTPTVAPTDVSGVMAALVQAQRDADIYRSAPSPEEAYKRAMANAGSGGGGGGGGVPGVIPGRIAGGAGASKVDDILKRMGGKAFGPPIIAGGTRIPDYTSPGPTYGSNYGDSADSYVGGPVGNPSLDFGGSDTYSGGAPWDFGGGNNFGFGMPWTGAPAGGGPILDAFDTSWMGTPQNYPGAGGGADDYPWEWDWTNETGGGGGGEDYYFPYGAEGF